jgi:lysophospholipase L1-like esterase
MAELGKVAGIKVILASVTPVIDYPWRKGLEPAPKIQALNAWIAQYCASNHLVYLDFYSALADANGGMKPGLSKDGVHPTDQGYAIMEPLAQAAIDKALKP